MKISIVPDYEQLSRAAADLIEESLLSQERTVLMPATGLTPTLTYTLLSERDSVRRIRADQLHLVQLDEYLDLAPSDPRSLLGWMRKSIADPLGIRADRIVSLDGNGRDAEQTCRRFDRRVAELGGIDLAILGLGSNGHVGFNEPPSSPSSRTRVVRLTAESVQSNARYWGGVENVPTQAITAGMDILLAARRILLLVAGQKKTAVLHRTIDGPMTPSLPASFLRTARDVMIIADREAWTGQRLEVDEGRDATVTSI